MDNLEPQKKKYAGVAIFRPIHSTKIELVKPGMEKRWVGKMEFHPGKNFQFPSTSLSVPGRISILHFFLSAVFFSDAIESNPVTFEIQIHI